jgi:hypothetical protein
MSGIEMKGFEQLRRDAERFGKAVADEALKAAEDAAAEAAKSVIESAAPRKSGQLAGSVSIVESHDKSALTGETRRRLLVGPTKKKGFYGFFLDKGWRHAGRAGRKGTKAGAGRSIPATHWFSNTMKSAEPKAQAAGEQAFLAKIRQLTG